MIDRAAGNGAASSGQANTTFDDLVTKGRGGKPARPTNGSDTLTGTQGRDFLSGRGGDDNISGRGGDDFINGGSGDDNLSGGGGNDLILGGKGNDRIRTGEGRDFVLAGSGNDQVTVKGSAYVDGGAGRDTVTLKGSEADYTVTEGSRGRQTYTSNAGDRVVLRNVENVQFSEPVAPPPPSPPAGEGSQLGPNDAGAERIIFGADSIRIIGPNTDFTFTGLTDNRAADGPLTASQGSGIINGEQTTAVAVGPFSDAVLSVGSGFNPTGTVDVDASFANGVTLDTQIVRTSGPAPAPNPAPVPDPIPAPVPTPAPIPGPGPVQGSSLMLEANSIGAERIIVGLSSVRLLGPGTDFTFTGITDGRPADGPLTATAGSGTINGVETTAVSLGNSNPFDPNASQVVFSLGSGFNATGFISVNAAFANGDRLQTSVKR